LLLRYLTHPYALLLTSLAKGLLGVAGHEAVREPRGVADHHIGAFVLAREPGRSHEVTGDEAPYVIPAFASQGAQLIVRLRQLRGVPAIQLALAPEPALEGFSGGILFTKVKHPADDGIEEGRVLRDREGEVQRLVRFGHFNLNLAGG